ncbi:type III secretion inner membrane ring lipoprotein SctJ [Robbsia sp. Bb-Pol-6]|uniref:Lipoprotein n=1 Tax=Robbsia betulipollinis TaxID=2981849 RepID=A0ABT3ZL72_9BURK|nr:type III secretion inner membrane ring lipoprotein SctJ [Robbsia betulipollinis]MCY0387207.1 type III secretion inner membrane ring lipoprotein SctJ [Robbsia betulipollinis]
MLPLASLLVLCACHNESLLSGLTEPQVNAVVAVLQRHGVSATKRDLGKNVFAVDVARNDFPAAVDLTRRYDLPQPAEIQISQAFPSDSLISTPLAEHSRLISYIEQRLSSNLSALNNVVRARVNVSYPLTGNIDTPKRMHVAVLVVYAGEVDQDALISEVKRYVRNSFDQIDYDDISVVVERGSPIFRGRLPGGSAVPTASGGVDWAHLCIWLAGIIGVVALLGALGFALAPRLASRPLPSPWLARLPGRRGGGDRDRSERDAPTQRDHRDSAAEPSSSTGFFRRFRVARHKVEPVIK